MHGTTRAGGSPEIRIADATEVPRILAADFEAHARASLAERSRFTIAIPGGSVATRCFPLLAGLALDWSAIDFFWADERAVPPDDPDSNYSAARTLWLEPAAVPAARIHRMPGEAANLIRAAQTYERELTENAGNPPRLDYVLLGVGPDGHVASLFPGHPACTRGHHVMAIDDAPKPPPRRLSLSLPVLTGARRVVLVAFGVEKARVLGEALGDAASTLPVARVAREARSCAFLLDRAAGSEVEGVA